MRKGFLNIAVFLVLGVFSLSGCATRIGDFTVISTKNMDVKDQAHIIENTRITGKDTAHVILFFPTGVPNLKEAIDNTIEKKPQAVGLSNATIKQGGWYIPFIYGQSYYIAEGNPILEK